MKVASFFAGCGGLDLGFRQAGFDVVWAHEYNKYYRPTYRKNNPDTYLASKNLDYLSVDDIPSCDGFIGAPLHLPWQNPHLIDLEYYDTYMSLLKRKHPKFFVFECDTPTEEQFSLFKETLKKIERYGYEIHYRALKATDFRVPQERERIFVVGFSSVLAVSFQFPKPTETEVVTLEKAIKDINTIPRFYDRIQIVKPNEKVKNHDVLEGRIAINPRLDYDKPSITLPENAWECPVVPATTFEEKLPFTALMAAEPVIQTHRRLSVRECARIQSFPDSYEFVYESIEDGYRMIFEATPPRVAAALAQSISKAMQTARPLSQIPMLVAYYKDDAHLLKIIQHSLYYVRFGLRRGALHIPVGMPMPQYLLLHNSGSKHLYRLDGNPPFYISGQALSKLGHSPSESHYIAFRLANTEEVNLPGFDIGHFQLMATGRDVALPYIVLLNL